MKSLYLRNGWEHIRVIKVISGSDNKPYADGYVLTLLLSSRARAHRFDDQPLHVGANTW